MEIGKPKRVYRIEPAQDPVPRRNLPREPPRPVPVKPLPAPAK